jgi:CheY-like chemotaxis protein
LPFVTLIMEYWARRMNQDKKDIGRIALQRVARSVGSAAEVSGVRQDVAALKQLSEEFGVPGIDLGQICLKLSDLDVLPREIAEQHRILPVLSRDDRLFVAMVDPRNAKIVDELEFVTGKKVYPYVTLEDALQTVTDEAYKRKLRGEEHYIGPRCPPEVLRKLGLGAAEQPEREPSLAPPPEPLGDVEGIVHDAPGVVVDDATDAASRHDEVEVGSFGETSKELSQVTELPRQFSTPLDPSTKTVLVVDDEADIRRMLTRLLSARGYNVIEADRGLLALRLVKENTPDLIVLDAMLPEVHGFEIARRIKGSKRYGHIPIIMISAVYRGWRYAQELKESCGVEHYIEKPFKITDVIHAVESAFGLDVPPTSAAQADLSIEAEKSLAAGIAAYKAGQLEEAIEHLKRGISIDPLAYRLHFHLGLLFGKSGMVYEAIGELETAVEMNSTHFPAVKNLAVLYQKAGLRNKAADTWKMALEIAPDSETRRSIEEHISSLQ